MKPTMKPGSRFIKSIIETARKNDVEMPWARSKARATSVTPRSASTGLTLIRSA